ncbi:MAG: UvrB/UvrC motif-containing protein [Candidatus Omnitrophica bacterium]|nr:UvrB/UvrC motif-containing protein [Candidatus Omnitrophota bacterium]
MLCNLCNKNQATVHLTEIVDDQMSELHLCDECARKKSMQMEQQFGLSDLLAGLVDYGKQLGGAEKDSPAMQCANCGLTYEDFRKIGRLGCSECYTSFAKYLGPLLKRIHGASMHTGKMPPGQAPEAPRPQKAKITKESTIDELKSSLQQAIEHEEFEDAARLRDKIKELEQKAKEPESNKQTEKKRKTKQ